MKQFCIHAAAFLFVVMLSLLGTVNHASAAFSCTFTTPDVNFGNVNLSQSGQTFNQDINFPITCTGGTVNGVAYICANFNAGSGGVNSTGSLRYMLGGGNQLPWNIYEDGGHSIVWGSTTWGLPPTPMLVSFNLDGQGKGNGQLQLHNQINSFSTSLPPGPYVSTFSGAQVQFAYANTSPTTCSAIGLMNLTAVSFNVYANYNTGCFVTATNMTFPPTSYLTAAVNTTNTIGVNCTNGTNYTVALNGGLTGATNPTLRKMANGATQITYGIYQNAAHTTAWGSTTGTNTESGTGTGLIQNYTAYGNVPIQTTPAPATYSDTIVVTVTY